jgi:hypothetical protein
MTTAFGTLFFYLFIAACVALSYGLGLPVDTAFLVVGGATALLVFWLFIREGPKPPPADGNAKLADSKELEKSGVSRDR